MIKPRFPVRWFGWLLSLLALSQTAQAHLTTYTGAERSSTVAEIWIDADRITLRLEIGEPDREAFAAFLDEGASKPDDAYQGLGLTGDDGVPLTGEVKVREQRPRTDHSAAPQAAAGRMPGSAMVTYVEIVYALAARPAALTLAPPRQEGREEAAAEIGFIVYHEAIPVIDFQYLRRPETLRPDWDDPWYSAFENPDLQRHHRAPVMTFLYVEPYEVRFEILIRLKALASWMPLDVNVIDVNVIDVAQIGAAEQARLRERIGQFVLQQSQVQIDGAAPHSRPRAVCQSDAARHSTAGGG